MMGQGEKVPSKMADGWTGMDWDKWEGVFYGLGQVERYFEWIGTNGKIF